MFFLSKAKNCFGGVVDCVSGLTLIWCATIFAEYGGLPVSDAVCVALVAGGMSHQTVKEHLVTARSVLIFK